MVPLKKRHKKLEELSSYVDHVLVVRLLNVLQLLSVAITTTSAAREGKRIITREQVKVLSKGKQ